MDELDLDAQAAHIFLHNLTNEKDIYKTYDVFEKYTKEELKDLIEYVKQKSGFISKPYRKIVNFLREYEYLRKQPRHLAPYPLNMESLIVDFDNLPLYLGDPIQRFIAEWRFHKNK